MTRPAREHHVELEPLVLRPVDCLLTLTLAAADELTVLAPGGEGDPGVIEHLLVDVALWGSLGSAGAFRLHEVAWEGAVGGTKSLARCIV